MFVYDVCCAVIFAPLRLLRLIKVSKNLKLIKLKYISCLAVGAILARVTSARVPRRYSLFALLHGRDHINLTWP